MTMPATLDPVIVEEASLPAQQAHVDWSAILAGIILAAAIATVLLTFGSAIGLSAANFHGGANASPVWIAIAAASWLLWVEVSSMMCGGYLAGRLRRRAHDVTEHESDVRDGAHGLIVWAGALLIGTFIAVSGVGAAAGAIGNIIGTATNAAGAAAGGVASKTNLDPSAYFTDALLRPGANAAPGANAPTGADATAEAGRILANGAVNGSISDDDKAYLAQLVASRTGLSTDEAKRRVDTVLTNVEAAKQKAADAAESARKLTVIAAFITAASLLVSAVGAYWAAMMGGNHRDRQTVFDFWFRRF